MRVESLLHIQIQTLLKGETKKCFERLNFLRAIISWRFEEQ